MVARNEIASTSLQTESLAEFGMTKDGVSLKSSNVYELIILVKDLTGTQCYLDHIDGITASTYLDANFPICKGYIESLNILGHCYKDVAPKNTKFTNT
jgi:hypothetical protein